MLSLEDIKWCAEECERQRSGEMSVYRMAEGLEYWRERKIPRNSNPITMGLCIKLLAEIIEPAAAEYRQIPVTFETGESGLRWELIPRAMLSLLKSIDSVSPNEFYKEFEEIHPFIDGNGRVGAVLFNWLKGNLYDLETPPNFWVNEA